MSHSFVGVGVTGIGRAAPAGDSTDAKPYGVTHARELPVHDRDANEVLADSLVRLSLEIRALRLGMIAAGTCIEVSRDDAESEFV